MDTKKPGRALGGPNLERPGSQFLQASIASVRTPDKTPTPDRFLTILPADDRDWASSFFELTAVAALLSGHSCPITIYRAVQDSLADLANESGDPEQARKYHRLLGALIANRAGAIAFAAQALEVVGGGV